MAMGKQHRLMQRLLSSRLLVERIVPPPAKATAETGSQPKPVKKGLSSSLQVAPQGQRRLPIRGGSWCLSGKLPAAVYNASLWCHTDTTGEKEFKGPEDVKSDGGWLEFYERVDSFIAENGFPPPVDWQMKFKAEDVESDDKLWELYERFIVFHNLKRSHADKVDRFPFFKDMVLYAFREMKRGDKWIGLGPRCDLKFPRRWLEKEEDVPN